MCDARPPVTLLRVQAPPYHPTFAAVPAPPLTPMSLTQGFDNNIKNQVQSPASSPPLPPLSPSPPGSCPPLPTLLGLITKMVLCLCQGARRPLPVMTDPVLLLPPDAAALRTVAASVMAADIEWGEGAVQQQHQSAGGLGSKQSPPRPPHTHALHTPLSPPPPKITPPPFPTTPPPSPPP